MLWPGSGGLAPGWLRPGRRAAGALQVPGTCPEVPERALGAHPRRRVACHRLTAFSAHPLQTEVRTTRGWVGIRRRSWSRSGSARRWRSYATWAMGTPSSFGCAATMKRPICGGQLGGRAGGRALAQVPGSPGLGAKMAGRLHLKSCTRRSRFLFLLLCPLLLPVSSLQPLSYPSPTPGELARGLDGRTWCCRWLKADVSCRCWWRLSVFIFVLAGSPEKLPG